MAIARVRPDVSSVVFLPTGETIHLRPDAAFDTEDWVVKNHAWAFQLDADVNASKRRSSVRVEQASAAPGELR
jgi:hypothetical protein|tara:strand:- start:59 stop:277 length:219 start_codon:yes stop_codon:yes gene_type:complete